MKLIKGELKSKILNDVREKVLKLTPYNNPVHKQIRKNFGWWGGDDLFRLKIDNPRLNIRSDLNETT